MRAQSKESASEVCGGTGLGEQVEFGRVPVTRALDNAATLGGRKDAR